MQDRRIGFARRTEQGKVIERHSAELGQQRPRGKDAHGTGALRTVAPFIETGLSVSPIDSRGCFSVDCERSSTWEWTAALWGHAGAGLEVRGERFRFRFYVGAAKVLNESAGKCSNPNEPCGSTPPADVVEVPYAGIAQGLRILT